MASTAFGRRLDQCPPLLVPLALVVAGTVVLCAGGWDTRIAELFHAAGEQSWPMRDAQPWRWLYDYGPVPALLLGISGLVILAGSFVLRRMRQWQKVGAFLVLSLAIGPGLIVNGLLKPYWGRPRPAQLADFGGTAEYIPVWQPGTKVTGTSFPSGHASMGFFLMVPGFLFYRSNRRLAILLFAFGLSAGLLIGTARIVQGRHFPSDVLWSAACVYYSTLVVYLLIGLHKRIVAGTSNEGSTKEVVLLPPTAEDGDFREAA
jgi:membrane-associated PAP2 superfamily phosphatase